MKKPQKIQDMFKRLLLALMLLATCTTLFAQAPSGVPYGNPEPVDLDLFNVLLFIVVPILIVITYFWYRRKKKRDNND